MIFLTGVKYLFKMIIPGRLSSLYFLFLSQSEQAKKRELVFAKNRRKVEELLGGGLPIKLEIGAGEKRAIPGWTYADINDNCDLILNLTQRLPFPDNSVDIIYSSHLLEHFTYVDLMSLLKECYRVLQPGGCFSVAVPNARIYLEAYQNPTSFDPALFCRHTPAYNFNSKIDYVNYMAYMAGHHRYMFDEENLKQVLINARFRNVRLRDFDPGLDLEVRAFQTIYAIGVK